MENAYEYKISAGVNDISTELMESLAQKEAIKNIKFTNNQKVDNTENKLLQETMINIPAMLFQAKKDLNFNINFFVSNDKIAINIPQLFTKYYYVNTNTLSSKWNSSAIGKQFPLDDDQIKIINSFQKTLQNANVDYAKLEKDGNKVIEKYNALFTKYLGRGVYTSEDSTVVDTKGGKTAATKTTLQLNQAVANTMMNEFVTLLENDKDVYNVLNSVYGTYSTLSETDIAQTIIDEVVDSMADYQFVGNVEYSIYTNGANQILRNEFDFTLLDTYYEEENKVNIKLDTKGKEYLLNDIALTIEVEDEYDSKGVISFTALGNAVPNNGVFDTKVALNIKTYDENELYEDIQVLAMDYKWDTKLPKNNLSLKMKFLNPNTYYYNDEDESVQLDIKGNMITDDTNKIVDMDFSNLRVSIGKEFICDLNFRMIFNKANSAEITIPQDSVNLVEMSKEEIDAEFESINKKLSGYYE
jgi:hypothetical protein